MKMHNSLYKVWTKDIKGENHWGFEILQGKFKNTIVEVSDLKFDEKDEGLVQADFHFINVPDTMMAEDLKTPEFDIVIEDVICDILQCAVENAKKEQNE
jgi:hypothetical protein